MIVEYDSSFEKWLSKIEDTGTLKKIEDLLLHLEAVTTLSDIRGLKKLTGFKKYYRVKIGDYRVGFEKVSKTTIRLIIAANRKDIYRRFP